MMLRRESFLPTGSPKLLGSVHGNRESLLKGRSSHILNVKVKNIEQWVANYNVESDLPKKILVLDNLPDDQWHGWKWIKHDQDGGLYFNIGAP